MKSKKDKRKCIDCKTWIGFMAFNAKRCKPCQETHRIANYQSKQFKAKQRAYHQQPEVKDKKRAYHQQPDVKAKQRAYQRAYSQQPDVKAKQRAYSKIRSEIANKKAHQILEAELKRIHSHVEVLR